MNLFLRFLTLDDLEHGFLEALDTLSPVGPVGTTLLWDTLARRRQEKVLTAVALEGGEVVGTASLKIDHKFLHGCSPAGRIEEVAVRRAYQGQGVGKQLVDFLVEQARISGVYKITLVCKPDKIGFYEKLGFHVTDDVHMRRDFADER